MQSKMVNRLSTQPISIQPYTPPLWHALMELRRYQLAEAGIIVPPEDMSDQPQNVGRDEYEWDYHHIAEIYLSGAGGFWLAWWEDDLAGHIAAQDLGGVIELRNMYVRAEYRRRGIAACLVQTLLDHCKTQPVNAIELWTARNGVGRKLYDRMGFKITSAPGVEFFDLYYRTNFVPGENEIRMRFDLIY
jgi:GNAT superfamily N-acetyltransferase